MSCVLRTLQTGTCPLVFAVCILRDIKEGARSDVDKIVAGIESKDSDAKALSVAECMAGAGLVGKVSGHNSL